MDTRDENQWGKWENTGDESNNTPPPAQKQAPSQAPQPPATPVQPLRKKRRENLTLKGLTIAGLTLLLLIPASLVQVLVNERAATQLKVERELSSKWASDQMVKGPVLTIPYLNDKGEEKLLTILPDRMDIKGTLIPEDRSRSQIFRVSFYQANVTFDGSFTIALPDLDVKQEALLLQKARLCFSVSDLNGINGSMESSWDGNPQKIVEGKTMGRNFEQGGMSIPVELTGSNLTQEHRFSLRLPLKGSGNLSFIPVGKANTAHLTSSWPSPKFFGAFLPSTPVVVTDKGFDATWEIVSYNRKYPQVWKDAEYNLADSNFGVTLLQPTDSYAKTQRSIKYALLFIALTFALYFCVEILQKRRVHPLQYVLVGLALSVFYTLLLSIGEYLGFDWAYLIAATATVSLIALYTISAFGKASIGALFAVVLAGLYGFIYLLIQLEEGALLVGSIGLFVLLAIIMYYTRGIDWYGNKDTLVD